MAVFRVEKVKDYTVMSNHHLRNINLLSMAQRVPIPNAEVKLCGAEECINIE